MNGQWLGTYKGTNEGTITLELDRFADHFGGNVFVYDNTPGLPWTAAPIRTPLNSAKFELSLPLYPIDPGTGTFTTLDELTKRFPDARPATKADTKWEVTDDLMTVSWTTDIGTNGVATLSRSQASAKSELAPEVKTWVEFVDLARERALSGQIFRGQEDNSWRLRTHYHRSGRADLIRYMQDDIPMTCLDSSDHA